MSLEELDQVILNSDPDAIKNLEDLKSNPELNSQTIEVFQYDDFIEKQKRRSQWIQKLRLKWSLFLSWSKTRLIDYGNRSIGGLKSFKTSAIQKKSNLSQQMRFWTWKEKLLFFSLFALAALAVTIGYLGFVKKTLFRNEELFIASMLTYADQNLPLEPRDMNDYYYNTVKIPKNIFNLRKIVVNIRPSENSGDNPMAAFELSIEATSREALVEIKDREGEILDAVQRGIEEFSYDEISGQKGRDLVVDSVRNRINAILTLGKIREVFIVGSIIKP